MKYLILVPVFAMGLFLTSCMTASLDQSTLPQTGASGKMNRTYIEGEPKSGLREISYKRHFTRSVQGTEDTLRVMLFVDPYVKLNAKVQAEDEGKERGYTIGQIDEEYQKIYTNNMKSWVQTKTCFDYEINSNTADAGNSANWDVQLKTPDGNSYPVELKFARDHLSGKGGMKWYQYTGIMCTASRVDPNGGFKMYLTPKYRTDKTIILTWE